MKKILMILTLLLTACGHRIMTVETYQGVPIGMTDSRLKETVGAPYSVRNLKDGKVEYKYIERISMGSRTVEERHYFFVLKNGRVVDKYVKSSSPPPYIENSYDMQTTTQNEY